MAHGVLLIDRDGTIIEEREYLSDPDEITLLPGAVEGLRAFKSAGYRLVLVTNQSGIGRGYFTEERLAQIHGRMNVMLAEAGVVLDQILYCPHMPEDQCSCRKPNTGLADRALRDCGARPRSIVVIGDKAIDIELGKRIAATTILVRTGYGERELRSGKVSPDHVAENIQDAACRIGVAEWPLQPANGEV